MDFDFFFSFSMVAIEHVWRSDSVKWGEEETKEGREREFGARKLKLWSFEIVKDRKAVRRLKFCKPKRPEDREGLELKAI